MIPFHCRYLMLNDLTFSLLRQHVRFVQLLNHGGSADLDLRQAFPRLVFLCVERRLEVEGMFFEDPPLRIEVFRPIPINELATRASPMWWIPSEGDVRPNRTRKQLLEDTRTLIIRKGGCLLPAADIDAPYDPADALRDPADADMEKPRPRLRFQLDQEMSDNDTRQTLDALMGAFASTRGESGQYTFFGKGHGFSGGNLRIEIECHRSALEQLIQAVCCTITASRAGYLDLPFVIVRCTSTAVFRNGNQDHRRRYHGR